MSDAATPTAAEPAMSSRAYVKTLLLAAALGFPVAFAALLFQSGVNGLSTLVWDDVPDGLGWNAPPWWYVIAVPGLAGLLVAAALRLPGKGGHAPIDGLSFADVRPVELVSILPAAVATLAFGLVLGPEAPLIAIGLALGALAVKLLREEQDAGGALLVLAGAFAAIATLFGGPLPAALLLFEAMAASGTIPAQAMGRALLPGLVAAGTGALVFTGAGDWPGIEETSLEIVGLPVYPTVRLADIGWGILIAVATAALIVATRRFALTLAARAAARPGASLVAAGLLVGALAVAFRAATDRPVDLVLFSGQAAVPAIVAETSAWVLVALIAAKALAYGLSLAAGFRGGPVFPAVVLGIAAGILAEAIVPGLELAPAVAAGVAAASAAVVRMPFFAVVMATLLVGGNAEETAPIAIFAAATGWLFALAVPERR